MYSVASINGAVGPFEEPSQAYVCLRGRLEVLERRRNIANTPMYSTMGVKRIDSHQTIALYPPTLCVIIDPYTQTLADRNSP